MALRLKRQILDFARRGLEIIRAHRWPGLDARNLEIVRYRLALPHLRAPLKLVHLTDLHASPSVPWSYLRESVALACQQAPDLFCLTGDYTHDGLADWAPLVETLAPLAQTAPTFAVMGNHDGDPTDPASPYEPTRQALRAAGVQLLENSGIDFAPRGDRVHLVGTGDYWNGRFAPHQAFAAQPGDTATILLTHNPDARPALLEYRWELGLCGHTHGGQVNFPGLEGWFAPISDRRFYTGLHRTAGRYLLVNRGVGAIAGIRFRSRPELTVLDLRPLP